MTTVWHVTMSLDGYIAGRDHAMAPLLEHADEAPSPLGRSVMEGTGAILAGRNWHDAAAAHYDGRHGIYGGAWDGTVFVLSHREPPPDADPAIRFLSSDVGQAVAAARDAAGGRSVGIFGADVARQCLDAGTLDEIVVHIAPILLGDGVRLYGGQGSDPVALERLELEPGEQVPGLRYRVKSV